jgi:hypothetical protein
MKPFIVYGLPRSRTFWLSRFLSYGDYACYHDQARYVRSLADVEAWFKQDYTGTCETGAARWHRLVRHIRPDIKVLVIRRHPDEVLSSLRRVNLAGVGTLNFGVIERNIYRMDAYLRKIDGLHLPYRCLVEENVCRMAFEHCLGYEFDRDWWVTLNQMNLQCDMRAQSRYFFANYGQMEAAGKRIARGLLRQLRPKMLSMGPPDANGITIQEEPLHPFQEDAAPLFEQHCLAVGEPEDQWKRKNLPLIERLEELGNWQIMTARCNGRVMGYLLTVVGQSLEHEGETVGTQTLFYTDPAASGSGLGLKLQRASIEGLKRRGVSTVVMRSGVRGEGPRISVLFRRLKAEAYGQLYRLSL